MLIIVVHVSPSADKTKLLLKVIHVHHDLRKMFITLVWND